MHDPLSDDERKQFLTKREERGSEDAIVLRMMSSSNCEKAQSIPYERNSQPRF
jgi:hypothetical protein